MGLTTGEIIGIVVVVITLLVFGIWIFLRCCKSCYKDIKANNSNRTTNEISFVKNLRNSIRRSFGRASLRSSQRNGSQNKQTEQQISTNAVVGKNVQPITVPVAAGIEKLKEERSELHPCFMKKDSKQNGVTVTPGSEVHNKDEQGYVKVVTEVTKPVNPPAHFQDNAPKDGELVRDKKHATEGYTTKEVFEGIVFKKKDDRVELCAEMGNDEEGFGGVEYPTKSNDNDTRSDHYVSPQSHGENNSQGFSNPAFLEDSNTQSPTASQPTSVSKYSRPNNTILYAGDIIVNTNAQDETREVYFDDFVNSQKPKSYEEDATFNV